MGLDITAYRASYQPSDESTEAPYDARADEVATIRVRFNSDTELEMLRLLGWRPTRVDGFGRWVAGEMIGATRATLQARQVSELSRPRKQRKDWERLIRFLVRCESALVDREESLVFVVG
jgi:hypothetical protein